MAALLELNPTLNVEMLRSEFERRGRLQVRDVLTAASAEALRDLLAEQTPWSLAWQAGPDSPPQVLQPQDLARMDAEEVRGIATRAAADPDYGFAYHSYPLVTAYLEGWNRGSAHERLLEELNGPEMLGFMRAVTGHSEIVKMDGQATLYAPGNFLRRHSDAESERGRLVAYVLNLTAGEWRPEWGGSLNFLDEDWGVDETFLPSFNCLNLFRVPQWHEVSAVSESAALARYAITGWARDR
jgi:Rps23 Pro-64 3,4-dihydroxylase Tpa1-like proline 4-hydroxylase